MLLSWWYDLLTFLFSLIVKSFELSVSSSLRFGAIGGRRFDELDSTKMLGLGAALRGFAEASSERPFVAPTVLLASAWLVIAAAVN